MLVRFAVLCEQNGVICSGYGACTVGGTCLCNNGKAGQFCEGAAEYTVITTSVCCLLPLCRHYQTRAN